MSNNKNTIKSILYLNFLLILYVLFSKELNFCILFYRTKTNKPKIVKNS